MKNAVKGAIAAACLLIPIQAHADEKSKILSDFKRIGGYYNIGPAVVCGTYSSAKSFFALMAADQLSVAKTIKDCTVLDEMVEMTHLDTVGDFYQVIWVLNGEPIKAWVHQKQFTTPVNWIEQCLERGSGGGEACYRTRRRDG